jgi:hypothetical protein
MYVATPELRWVVRYVDLPGYPEHGQSERFLQQRWVLASTERMALPGPDNSEWRDVPLVGAA